MDFQRYIPLVARLALASSSPSARRDSYLFKPFGGLIESLEQPLIFAERAAVIAGAPRDYACRMFNVKHLVIQDVLDHKARDGRVVERAADDDCPMDVIVVAQQPPRFALAPGKQRTIELAAKVAGIQF